MKNVELVVISVLVLSFILSFTVFPLMPDYMAYHWNIEGRVDSYAPKFWALFFIPFVSFFAVVCLKLVPRIDPLKRNIKKFEKEYRVFIAVITFFLLYIHLLAILWNFGYKFDFSKFLIPAFAILLYYIGVLTSKAEQNWFIGIRTPWTLSSKNVWKKTHERASVLYKLSAGICLLGILFPSLVVWFILIPILSCTVYAIVYSYLEFGRVNDRTRKRGQRVKRK
jgi:uncharacterized membrane protein